MGTPMTEASFFGTEKTSRILLKIALPVMLTQLIQAMYNIVDSFFVGKYSADALTALTVIYPLQLIIIALAVGTGVGVNTYMARKYAQDRTSDADNAAGCGMVLAAASWLILMITALLVMHPYVMMLASSEGAINDAVVYGNIVCIGSLGIFLEGNWTKVLQAEGNMRLPMAAQIIGVLVNIVLDPILIFGIGPFPQLGVAGEAYATVLGLYYKWQSFFIPLFGLETCIVPVLSYNYACNASKRCTDIMSTSFLTSAAFMVLGLIEFVFFPEQIISVFSDSAKVKEIGRTAFPIIGASFLPAVISLMMPVFFQVIGDGKTSMFLSFARQIFCLVPLFWLFSLIGLSYAWIGFPAAETISGAICLLLYCRILRSWGIAPKK